VTAQAIPRALNDAADYIEKSLMETGYSVQRQEFEAHDTRCFNLEAEILGTTKPKEIVLVCAHYDSVIGCPGANDNGSGTAALLVLAKSLRTVNTDRTIRFVFVTNEEPPISKRRDGSYARRCRQQAKILRR
jgi:acetylornithine deacetylase/succinyl-diaminopimelate desuccinylase-like protein